MTAVFKIYKILSSLYFLILILGFIFPTQIRNNIIGMLEILSSEDSAGMIVGVSLIFFSILIFWFVPTTLLKLFSSKGNFKIFWDEL